MLRRSMCGLGSMRINADQCHPAKYRHFHRVPAKQSKRPMKKPIAGKAGIGPHLSIFNLPSKPISAGVSIAAPS